jgi:hypothetical protein
MTRAQRILVFVILILEGVIPVIVYSVEHGGLGIPAFGEHQTMTTAQQFAQVVAGLYIKPTYMLISLAIIILLIGQTAREITSVFWGLITFLVGEIFCAINFITYKHASIVSEYIHSYGMALAFGFFTYALLEIFDARLFHINSGACAANELCRICKRTSPLHCSARRIAMLTIAMAGIVSFLPLSVSVSPNSYLTDLFGFAYSYARFDFYQWYETRALPLLALAFFIIAFLPLLKTKGDPIPQTTKIFFSAGLGALGFSLFRVILASMFANNLVWFEFWEELTELMFITATGFMLWQFHNSLLQRTPILDLVPRRS